MHRAFPGTRLRYSADHFKNGSNISNIKHIFYSIAMLIYLYIGRFFHFFASFRRRSTEATISVGLSNRRGSKLKKFIALVVESGYLQFE